MPPAKGAYIGKQGRDMRPLEYIENLRILFTVIRIYLFIFYFDRT